MKERLYIIFFVLVTLLTSPLVAKAQKTVIHAGTLLDVPGQRSKSKQSVVIEFGKIVDIQDGFISIPNAQEIDLSSHYVLPGLIDTHVHLQFGGADYLQQLVRLEDSVLVLRAYAEANKSLNAGFTTLRDMGGDPDVIFGLRDAINSGYVNGPTIISAGPVLMPTGGGIIRGFRRDIMGLLSATNLEYPCNGADSCRQAVRQLVKDGADLIKLVVTSSILAPNGRGFDQQMTFEEITAAVDAAHSLGVRVSAHAHGLKGIKLALQAGVDSIEHGSLTDKPTIDLYLKKGAYFVPTLSSMTSLERLVEDGKKFSPTVKENVSQANQNLFEILNFAYKKNVKIAFGTDVNVGMHGSNAKEFLLLKKAGMTETDMIRSATIIAAELLGLSERVGTITIGKDADIIATEGNPIKNISELLNVNFVMKQGKVVKN